MPFRKRREKTPQAIGARTAPTAPARLAFSGDPVGDKKNAVYGYASLGKKNAIVILRNPSDKPQSFKISYKEIFELPDGHTVSTKGVKKVYDHDAKYTVGKDSLSVDFQPFGIVLLQFPAQ